MKRVSQKWGFGNAPLKPSTEKKNRSSIENLLAIIDREILPDPTPYRLESISTVKGLFNRTLRQDQWDWYTVWTLLGRPSRGTASKSVKALVDLRASIKDGQDEAFKFAVKVLRNSKAASCLKTYLDGGPTDDDVQGYIYILSERSQPELLKIGMTTRSVEERVKEINAATGVAVPFGVRAVWRVHDPKQAESDIHALLDEYRLRNDREFFRMRFNDALDAINTYIKSTT